MGKWLFECLSEWAGAFSSFSVLSLQEESEEKHRKRVNLQICYVSDAFCAFKNVHDKSKQHSKIRFLFKCYVFHCFIELKMSENAERPVSSGR